MVGCRQVGDRGANAFVGEYDGVALAGKVNVLVVPETVILEITATDTDPETARDIAQAYAEGLSATVADLETPDGGETALIKASIVDDARVNPSPVTPNLPRNMGLALVLGLLPDIRVAVLRHLLATRVPHAANFPPP